MSVKPEDCACCFDRPDEYALVASFTAGVFCSQGNPKEILCDKHYVLFVEAHNFAKMGMRIINGSD